MQLHVRAPWHKERMIFDPAKGVFNLLSDSKALSTGVCLAGSLNFRFDLSADEERLEPCAMRTGDCRPPIFPAAST